MRLRAMKFVCFAFRDSVDGSKVNLYRDHRGDHWLATRPRSSFRVRCKNPAAWTGRLG